MWNLEYFRGPLLRTDEMQFLLSQVEINFTFEITAYLPSLFFRFQKQKDTYEKKERISLDLPVW